MTLLAAALGVPKLFPKASPRRVIRIGFALLFAGLVVLLFLLDIGSGPEIVTWPLLLAGLGIGSLASQLGAVTVSAVPDEQSGEVGGIQNTVTNLGASIGTALAGAILISVLTTTFLGTAWRPTRPSLRSWPTRRRSSCRPAYPFVSDAQLSSALEKAGVPRRHGDGDHGRQRREPCGGPAGSLAVLALIALVASP